MVDTISTLHQPSERGNRTDTIYLSFHQLYSHGYEGHSYAKLHFDGDFVTLTRQTSDPKRVSFSPDVGEKTADGAQIWPVDHIFRDFELPDAESYPWVSVISILPKTSVSGMNCFQSFDQQERFIFLLTTLLSCHNGGLHDALDGSVTKGKAVFGERLLKGLESGEFVG
ncbi:hypothetical protein [Ruegeria jejuensis]|uniref:hypothetical protein n=1 Tax=Ruegeria jejuensis TaxID=3233338 RepID=UPI00355BB5EA